MSSNCCVNPMVVATYQTNAGVSGGQATDGSGGNWQTYPINTLRVNDFNIASLDGNNILLPAGTYRIVSGSASITHWSRCNIRVIRTDISAMLTDCIPGYDSGVDTFQYPQLVPMEFTLQAATEIQMQYLAAYSQGSDSNDLGIDETDVTTGSFNTFGQIQIIRISPMLP